MQKIYVPFYNISHDVKRGRSTLRAWTFRKLYATFFLFFIIAFIGSQMFCYIAISVTDCLCCTGRSEQKFRYLSVYGGFLQTE